MVSIIIPIYNGEKTILRALESVACQYVCKELIVVDDFSTDKSMDIVERFSENRNFNIIITSVGEYSDKSKPTGVPNAARNIGVYLANGEYIALLDQDDWWVGDKLAEQVLAIYGCDICSTSFIAHDLNTGKERLHGRDTNQVVLVDNMFERFLMLDKTRQTLMSTLMFRKDIYPPMDGNGITDFHWTSQLLKNHRVAVIEKPLVYRGVSGNNASYNSKIRDATLKEQLQVLLKYGEKYDLRKSKKKIYGSYTRYLYQQKRYNESRHIFWSSRKGVKEIAYYFTSFIPPLARWVSNKFCVWGDN